MLILDTHILLYALAGGLRPKEKKALSDQPWSISGIALWEITMLKRRRRIEFDWKDPAVIKALGRIHVWPITQEVSRVLENLDFRGDPADEIMAATSLLHKLPFATRDANIRKSKLLKFPF